MRKQNRTMLFIFPAVILILSACTSTTEVKQVTHEELAQMNKDFVKALNAKDAAGAAACYEENAKLLPPNEPTVEGRANIQKYWQGAIDGGVTDAAVTSIVTSSNGDLGYEEGKYSLNIHQPGGIVVPEHGKYIEILHKGSDGKWRSVYGIWNVDTPAAPMK